MYGVSILGYCRNNILLVNLSPFAALSGFPEKKTFRFLGNSDLVGWLCKTCGKWRPQQKPSNTYVNKAYDLVRQPHCNLGIPFVKKTKHIHIYSVSSSEPLAALRSGSNKTNAPDSVFVVVYTSCTCTHYAKVSIRLNVSQSHSFLKPATKHPRVRRVQYHPSELAKDCG